MGDLLATGSVLAAFLAGGVALFAPCCIVFLAPSYMAVAVKNRRWRLLPLTFVFAAGLALVLVPITLGVSLLSSAIANYHAPLYLAGGALMLALAAFSLSGRMMTLPRFLAPPDTTRGDALSFFGLGVFSGIASSCCAPVLAGIMTLSALSGSVAGGLTLGLAYTFGMVFPLFAMALAWDRFRLGERRFMRAKSVTLTVRGHSLHTNTINIGVAAAFAVMGGFVLYLASTGTMTGGPGFQVGMGKALASLFTRIETFVAPVPEPLLGLAVLAIAAIFVTATLRDGRRRADSPTSGDHERTAQGDDLDDAPACHTPSDAAARPHSHPEHHSSIEENHV